MAINLKIIDQAAGNWSEICAEKVARDSAFDHNKEQQIKKKTKHQEKESFFYTTEEKKIRFIFSSCIYLHIRASARSLLPLVAPSGRMGNNLFSKNITIRFKNQ